ncbi:sensor histidine kinase [Amycolatopsis marina]|nr:sensor histidine kinase [Amycolatopsis marina]
MGAQSRDVLLALVLVVVGVFGTLGADQRTTTDVPVDALALTMVVLSTAAVAVRRRWPLAVLTAAALITSAYLVLGYTFGPILFSFMVAVYTVARHVALPRSAVAATLAMAILLLHLIVQPGVGVLGVIPGSAWAVVPFAVGVTVRLTRQSAEQTRAEIVRQHVDEERLRVAQEVHDVVGHGLAAIKMQADVALHLLARKPEQAEIALTTISRTSTDALDELRATLTAVRRSGAGTSRTPAPGLAGLGELTSRLSAAGVHVNVEQSGAPRPLPAAVDLTAYRVVQESLTNVLRHSGAQVALVRVAYQTDEVIVTVGNPRGSAPAAGDGQGLGLAGMRERVHAVGGSFAAGPTREGGFEVRCVLPTGGGE